MNLQAVRDVLYDIAEMFFQGATVMWAEQMNTKPKVPYVTLKVNGINKTLFPIEEEDDRYYSCDTVWEVNLHTQGKPVTVEKNVTGNYTNTATSDMLDFFKFIESDNMIDYLAGRGVNIILIPPVRDLSDLQNGTSYRYRTMAEATVSWSEDAKGPYGIGGMAHVPNPSGGGTSEMADAVGESFVTAEIEMIEGGNE